MAKWYKMPRTMRTTMREYRANVEGINIVFGAVLGFVLADASAMEPMKFGLLLVLSASSVVTILYLGQSNYKLFYAAIAAAYALFLPRILLMLDAPPMPKLQPTLLAWIAMVLFVEMAPKTYNPGATEETET